MRRRSRRPFDPNDICGDVDDPPPLTLDPVLVDWSDVGTTADQDRIEEALEGMQLPSAATILHVGVGNSRLAQRFAARVAAIDGLTVSHREKQLGDSLLIDNYTIHVLNKYSGRIVGIVSRRYDFIVDNNVASFACCAYHLYRMFDEYRQLLHRQGRILTDAAGLAWRVGDDPDWVMSYEDLEAIGERFGLRAARMTDTVFELRRG